MATQVVDLLCNNSVAVTWLGGTSSVTEKLLIRHQYWDIPDWPISSRLSFSDGLLGFEKASGTALKGKAITQISLVMHADTPSVASDAYVARLLAKVFEPGQSWSDAYMTWGNQPKFSKDLAYFEPLSLLGKPGGQWIMTPAPSNLNMVVRQLCADDATGLQLSVEQVYNISVNIYSRIAAVNLRPFLRVTGIDAQPVIMPNFINNTYVNPYIVSTFNWIADGDIRGYVIPGGANWSNVVFQWRIRGASDWNSHTQVDTSLQAVSIPALTFPVMSMLEFRMQGTTTEGFVAEWSDIINFHTVDSTPITTAISPRDTYVSINDDAVFDWTHDIATSTLSTGAEGQYLPASGGMWIPLFSTADAITHTTVPANTLPSGMLRWMVRSKNADGIFGAWSDPVSFMGTGTPRPPTITDISNQARPILSWQSLEQVSIEFYIETLGGAIIHRSGEIATLQRQIRLATYIAPGEYVLNMRIRNSDLVWSSWASFTFILSYVQLPVPFVSAENVSNGARLVMQPYHTDFTARYVLRNDVPVAKMDKDIFIDFAASGKTTYVIRIVKGFDTFIDSEEIPIDVRVDSATLANVNNLSRYVILQKMPAGQPKFNRTKTFRTTSKFYAGRTLPVVTFSGQRNEITNSIFYVTKETERDLINEMIAQEGTLLYRDLFGNYIYCIIDTVNESWNSLGQAMMYMYTYTLQCVDYVDAIEYI